MQTNTNRERITRTDKPARSGNATKPRKAWQRHDKRGMHNV